MKSIKFFPFFVFFTIGCFSQYKLKEHELKFSFSTIAVFPTIECGFTASTAQWRFHQFNENKIKPIVLSEEAVARIELMINKTQVRSYFPRKLGQRVILTNVMEKGNKIDTHLIIVWWGQSVLFIDEKNVKEYVHTNLEDATWILELFEKHMTEETIQKN